MSVVEILKKWGGVTLPDEVIQAAKRKSANDKDSKKAQEDDKRQKKDQRQKEIGLGG
ncbi:MAG: hypothetical protein ABSH32_21875 [Bryobacteraceae bacterium]|jgi:hypothetical protein